MGFGKEGQLYREKMQSYHICQGHRVSTKLITVDADPDNLPEVVFNRCLPCKFTLCFLLQWPLRSSGLRLRAV